MISDDIARCSTRGPGGGAFEAAHSGARVRSDSRWRGSRSHSNIHAFVLAGLIGLILMLSVLPNGIRTPLPSVVEHFLAYGIAGGVLALLYRGRFERWLIVVGLVLFALLLEVVQWPMASRDASLLDFASSAAGGCTGSALAVYWR